MAQITSIACCYCRRREIPSVGADHGSDVSHLATMRRLITGLFIDVPAAVTVAYVMVLLESVTSAM